MCDTNDLIIAESRLSDFNKIFTIAINNWDTGRPASELMSITSTACYIIRFLIRELSQFTDGLEAKDIQKMKG